MCKVLYCLMSPALGTGLGLSESRHTSIVWQLSRLHTQVWEAVCRRGSKLRRESGGRVTGARSAAHVGPCSESQLWGLRGGKESRWLQTAVWQTDGSGHRPCVVMYCNDIYIIHPKLYSNVLVTKYFKLVLIKAEIKAHNIFIVNQSRSIDLLYRVNVKYY